MKNIQDELKKLSDSAYRDFHSRLIPNIDRKTILGVRVPILRKFSKTLSEQEKIAFYDELPHAYYDENMLHALLLCAERDYNYCLEQTEKFLPFIDNWAVCDLLLPKVFARYKKEILVKAEEYTHSEKTYTVRFGIGLLMRHFLDGDFTEDIFRITLAVQSDEYYIKMMLAWFYATALCKQWDTAFRLIENGCLPTWIHNKTIQKAVESYRITDDQKTILKALRKKSSVI